MPVKYSSLVAISEKDIIKLLKKQDLTLTGDQATHIKQLARYLVELNMDDDINIQQI